jgi:hypothetical protein
MSDIKKFVTISELKQSPAKVIDEAKRTGRPVPIIRNNQVEGHFVPVNAMQLIRATDDEVRTAFAAVVEHYGDSLTWLAKN